MRNSDSESNNECFESAEESLDEDDGLKNFKMQSKESESHISTPICNNCNVNYALQTKKDTSGNPLSYRKRPQRVKRLHSNTPAKLISKSPSNELIIKANKIGPDAFFHDITNNLSKNINKGLSTLQQKSSNVKDLILSSLPVLSVNDSKGFCYDDSSHMFHDENNISDTESEQASQSNLKCDELVQSMTIENKEDSVLKERGKENGEELIAEKPSAANNDNNKLKKSPDVKNDNIKKGFDEEFSTLISNVKNKKNNFKELNKVHFDNNKEKILSGEIIENSQKSNNIQSEPKGIEISYNQKGISSNAVCSKKLVNVSEALHQQNGDLKINKEESIEPIENIMKNKNENLECREFSEPKVPNQLYIREINLAALEGIGSSRSSGKSDPDQNDFNFSEEEKIGSSSNIEELKEVLKNIVKEDKINLQNNTQELKSRNEEQDTSFLKEIQASSNDGWDDFDFSDHEIENSEKTYISGGDFIEKLNDDVKIKATIAGTKEVFKNEKNKAGKKNSDVTLKKQDDLIYKVKEDQGKHKEPQHTREPDPAQEDSWDWDNWDETPEMKKEKFDGRQIDHESTDNCTVWDKFAQKPQEKQSFNLSWGVDIILNKATTVTQGISNVLEAGLGAPDPETLARMEKSEREKFKEEDIEEDLGEISKKNSVTNVPLFPGLGITNLVAGVTSKIVEHSKIHEIGSKVITGGLDTLETFGKKTMEVLQEGDPGLKNKRALLMGNNKVVLSQVLKEAREKAEKEIKKAEENEMAKKCHFETLFDDFQGKLHLEALKMLSRQCELKLEQIKSGMNPEEQEDLSGILEEVEQLCTLDECDLEFKSLVLDFKSALQMAVEPLKNEISVQKIIQMHDNVNKWVETSSKSKPSLALLNQKLVSTLAEMTATIVHQFHKSGELLSVKECRKTVEEIDALLRLTNLLCKEINSLYETFTSLSHNQTYDERDDETLNSITEKVTVAMKNSTSYIRQAFVLLIPVIQLGAAV